MLADHVLFIDAEAIVVDKPAGLPVDAPRDGALSVQSHLSSLRFGFERWPVAVHRLDRDTSGCLLLARNPRATKRFGQAFEAGEVDKLYWAVLDGTPDTDAGMIDLPLAKISSREAGWRIVADPKGKAARTAWRVLDRVGTLTLVEFRPETGRTHQLRVHAATGLGMPILDDPVYGRGVAGRPMLLHARSLTMKRPGKAAIAAEAPVPERFAALGFLANIMPRSEPPPLPEAALDERFLAATGPGGQNVNKVATACQLRLDVGALDLPADARERLIVLAGTRWTTDGAIIVTARAHRTREANRAEARARLADMVARALVRPVRRVKTRPSRSAREARMTGKALRGTVKRARGRVSDE